LARPVALACVIKLRLAKSKNRTGFEREITGFQEESLIWQKWRNRRKRGQASASMWCPRSPSVRLKVIALLHHASIGYVLPATLLYNIKFALRI